VASFDFALRRSTNFWQSRLLNVPTRNG
jgi:hypothetical protein